MDNKIFAILGLPVSYFHSDDKIRFLESRRDCLDLEFADRRNVELKSFEEFRVVVLILPPIEEKAISLLESKCGEYSGSLVVINSWAAQEWQLTVLLEPDGNIDSKTLQSYSKKLKLRWGHVVECSGKRKDKGCAFVKFEDKSKLDEFLSAFRENGIDGKVVPCPPGLYKIYSSGGEENGEMDCDASVSKKDSFVFGILGLSENFFEIEQNEDRIRFLESWRDGFDVEFENPEKVKLLTCPEFRAAKLEVPADEKKVLRHLRNRQLSEGKCSVVCWEPEVWHRAVLLEPHDSIEFESLQNYCKSEKRCGGPCHIIRTKNSGNKFTVYVAFEAKSVFKKFVSQYAHKINDEPIKVVECPADFRDFEGEFDKVDVLDAACIGRARKAISEMSIKFPKSWADENGDDYKKLQKMNRSCLLRISSWSDYSLSGSFDHVLAAISIIGRSGDGMNVDDGMNGIMSAEPLNGSRAGNPAAGKGKSAAFEDEGHIGDGSWRSSCDSLSDAQLTAAEGGNFSRSENGKERMGTVDSSKNQKPAGRRRGQVIYKDDEGGAAGNAGSPEGKREAGNMLSQAAYSSLSGPGMQNSEKFLLKFSLCADLSVLVFHADMTKHRCDALVNAANGQLNHSAGLARALSLAAGPRFPPCSRKLVEARGEVPVGGAVQTPGFALPCELVIHAVGPDHREIKSLERCKELLQKTFVRALELANDLRCQTVALPAISSGIYGMPHQCVGETLVKSLEYFQLEVPKVYLKEIHVVVNDAAVISAVLKAFHEFHHKLPHLAKDYDMTQEGVELIGREERKRREKEENSNTGVLYSVTRFMGLGSSSSSSTDPSVSHEPMEVDGPERPGVGQGQPAGPSDGLECPICLEQKKDEQELKFLTCNHVFCKICIEKHFAVKGEICPVCRHISGPILGDQPQGGTMQVTQINHPLPGYDRYDGHHEIIYNIPSGVQQSYHPTPGKCYQGTTRCAYLPDTVRGRQVLRLLRQAWEQRLIFTIGNSNTRTDGNAEERLVWNDIHHKTSRSGGPQNYGYPDAGYLDRLLDELKAKGIE